MSQLCFPPPVHTSAVHRPPNPGQLHIDSRGRVIAHIDQHAARLDFEAKTYLAGAARLLPGVEAERAVRFGDPVHEIIEEAEAFGADLIAVTTTGRSGLRRAVLGSVAEQVFNRSSVPVMLYHNNAPGP